MTWNGQWKYFDMNNYEQVWSKQTSKKNICLGHKSLLLLRDQPIFAGEADVISQYVFFLILNVMLKLEST